MPTQTLVDSFDLESLILKGLHFSFVENHLVGDDLFVCEEAYSMSFDHVCNVNRNSHIEVENNKKMKHEDSGGSFLNKEKSSSTREKTMNVLKSFIPTENSEANMKIDSESIKEETKKVVNENENSNEKIVPRKYNTNKNDQNIRKKLKTETKKKSNKDEDSLPEKREDFVNKEGFSHFKVDDFNKIKSATEKRSIAKNDENLLIEKGDPVDSQENIIRKEIVVEENNGVTRETNILDHQNITLEKKKQDTTNKEEIAHGNQLLKAEKKKKYNKRAGVNDPRTKKLATKKSLSKSEDDLVKSPFVLDIPVEKLQKENNIAKSYGYEPSIDEGLDKQSSEATKRKEFTINKNKIITKAEISDIRMQIYKDERDLRRKKINKTRDDILESEHVIKEDSSNLQSAVSKNDPNKNDRINHTVNDLKHDITIDNDKNSGREICQNEYKKNIKDLSIKGETIFQNRDNRIEGEKGLIENEDIKIKSEKTNKKTIRDKQYKKKLVFKEEDFTEKKKKKDHGQLGNNEMIIKDDIKKRGSYKKSNNESMVIQNISQQRKVKNKIYDINDIVGYKRKRYFPYEHSFITKLKDSVGFVYMAKWCGDTLATASKEGILRIYDTGKLTGLKRHNQEITAIDWYGKNEISLGLFDGTLFTYKNISQHAEPIINKHHNGPIFELKYYKNNDFSSNFNLKKDDENQISFLNTVYTIKKRETLEGSGIKPSAPLLAASYDGSASVLDGNLSLIEIKRGSVNDCSWLDEQRVLACTENNKVCIVTWEDLHIEYLDGHEDSVLSVSHNKEIIASTSRDGKCILWNIEMGRKAVLVGHKGPVNLQRWAENGSCFLSAGFDGKLKVWDVNTATHRCTYGHNGEIYGLDYSEQRNLIVTGSVDQNYIFWDLRVGQVHKFFAGSVIQDVKFSGSTNYISVCTAGDIPFIHDIRYLNNKL